MGYIKILHLYYIYIEFSGYISISNPSIILDNVTIFYSFSTYFLCTYSSHFLTIFFYYEFFPFTKLFRNIYVRVSIFYRCIVVVYIFSLWLDLKHICQKLSTVATLMALLSSFKPTTSFVKK